MLILMSLCVHLVAQSQYYTVNVDIFACIHFRTFPKIGNFARIYFRVFDIIAPM